MLLSRYGRNLREGVSLSATALLGGSLAAMLGLPAAWLIGSLLATVLLSSVRPTQHVVSRRSYIAAQAVVGATLGASFDPRAFATLARYWPLVGGSVAVILGLSVGGGLLLARWVRLDPATAVLGMIPGGAPGMIAMSDELGADTPLVACMQYTRLCLVAVSASLFARFIGAHPSAGELTLVAPVVASHWSVYSTTTIVALLGAWAGLRWRLPAGALVGPVLLGVIGGALGIRSGSWPPAVLPIANAVIGVWVGSRFDRAALTHVGRLMGPIAGLTVALMAGCALVSWVWVALIGLDPLSAYLATTPGGIDAVTIAALDSGAMLSVILPVQVLRLLVMVLAGPFLVRWLHGRAHWSHQAARGHRDSGIEDVESAKI